MGTGTTFREQQLRRVDLPECGVEVMAGSLLTNHQSQHGVGQGGLGGSRGGPPPPPPPPLSPYPRVTKITGYLS